MTGILQKKTCAAMFGIISHKKNCPVLSKSVMLYASCKIKCDTESPSPKVSIGAQTALAGWGDRGKDDNESFPLVEAMK